MPSNTPYWTPYIDNNNTISDNLVDINVSQIVKGHNYLLYKDKPIFLESKEQQVYIKNNKFYIDTHNAITKIQKHFGLPYEQFIELEFNPSTTLNNEMDLGLDSDGKVSTWHLGNEDFKCNLELYLQLYEKKIYCCVTKIQISN